jgi:hypothetical protein
MEVILMIEQPLEFQEKQSWWLAYRFNIQKVPREICQLPAY